MSGSVRGSWAWTARGGVASGSQRSERAAVLARPTWIRPRHVREARRASTPEPQILVRAAKLVRNQGEREQQETQPDGGIAKISKARALRWLDRHRLEPNSTR